MLELTVKERWEGKDTPKRERQGERLQESDGQAQKECRQTDRQAKREPQTLRQKGEEGRRNRIGKIGRMRREKAKENQ